jgi:hypothetical protein
MSKKNGRDYILLIWKEPKKRRNYIVGELSINGNYEFKYCDEIDKAIKDGFELVIPFDDIDKVYKRDILFPAFTSRLPDKKRRGIENILQKYELEEYDEYKLLKRSGAKLPIDNLEFIDPILENDIDFIREFYIQGIRYYNKCQGTDCLKEFSFELNKVLEFELEPNNKHDVNAVKIMCNDHHIGYVPRYYSESLTKQLKKGNHYECRVIEINKHSNCDECVNVILKVSKN